MGAMLRLRIYPRWGVTGKEVGEVVSFGVITYYMGISFVTSAAFLFEGAELTDLLGKLPKVGGILGQPWMQYGVPAGTPYCIHGCPRIPPTFGSFPSRSVSSAPSKRNAAEVTNEMPM